MQPCGLKLDRLGKINPSKEWKLRGGDMIQSVSERLLASSRYPERRVRNQEPLILLVSERVNCAEALGAGIGKISS